jgi:hypothetical protein
MTIEKLKDIIDTIPPSIRKDKEIYLRIYDMEGNILSDQRLNERDLIIGLDDVNVSLIVGVV